eukprot:m.86199 g.86199  ORF g.86199 m.86199 type:complete len:308 (-) comp14457_c0_seq1:207-1130(-)
MADAIFDLALAPVNTVRTLMMLGYEPRPEFKSRSLFHGEGYRRVGFFSYARALYQNQGALGLIGSWPISYLEAATKRVVATRATAYLVDQVQKNFPKVDRESLAGHILYTGAEVLGSCAGAIASHPLRVISINVIANSVNGESKLGVWPLFNGIYNDFGIQGYFRGLTAHVIFEAVRVISLRVCTHLLQISGVFDMIVGSIPPADGEAPDQQQQLQQIIAMQLPLLVATSISSYAYHPWDVTSRVMAIAGSTKLQLALPPYQPVNGFASVWDCYTFLWNYDRSYFSSRGLFRGASLGPRFYKTPLRT